MVTETRPDTAQPISPPPCVWVGCERRRSLHQSRLRAGQSRHAIGARAASPRRSDPPARGCGAGVPRGDHPEPWLVPAHTRRAARAAPRQLAVRGYFPADGLQRLVGTPSAFGDRYLLTFTSVIARRAPPNWAGVPTQSLAYQLVTLRLSAEHTSARIKKQRESENTSFVRCLGTP